MKAVLVSICLVLALSTIRVALAEPSHPDSFRMKNRGGRLYREAVEAMTRSMADIGHERNTTPAWWFPQVDPKNASYGTFGQRYFEDRTYATADSNIAMLYISGEAPSTGSIWGQPVLVAKNLSCLAVTVEHRFYGESLPAPWTDKDMFRFLTIENAMHDFATFTQWYNKNIAKKTLTWFVVGGSYAGGLSAWLRTTYPEVFVASWSSSGVVNPIFNFYQFDAHVKSVIDPKCTESIRNVLRIVSEKWETEAGREEVRTVLNSPDYFTLTDMQWMLADASAQAVQYGSKLEMCNAILPIPYDDRQALKMYKAMIEDVWGPGWTSNCGYSTYCLKNASFAGAQWLAADYPWVYQCCSQVGWWQNGYPSAIRPENVSTTYFMNQCKEVFWPEIFPDTYSFDLRHGGANPTTKGATRVIALQGSDDPWSTAGVRQTLSQDYIEVTAQCTGCGHCGDLFSGSTVPGILHQQAVTMELLNKWVKGN